jgi:ketosteroid isomerase-like protein
VGTDAANLATVQGIYEAFGRGDIPAILGSLAEDVAWEQWADNAAQRAGVPWLQARTGREGALEFFKIIGQWVPEDFQVTALMAGSGRVAAQLTVAFRLPSGKTLRDEEMHLWAFDSDGRVSSFRHYSDTAKHIEASRP